MAMNSRPDRDAELPPTAILLIGMMGGGKTVIGQVLAAELGIPYIDNDDLVLGESGLTSRQILMKGGTVAVREVEAVALKAALAAAESESSVVGVAGGTILDPQLRELLRAHDPVVWLRAMPATLARRTLVVDTAGHGAHRPWHDADRMTPEEWFARETEQRAALYASVSDLTVDVDAIDGTDRPVVDIVREIRLGVGLA